MSIGARGWQERTHARTQLRWAHSAQTRTETGTLAVALGVEQRELMRGRRGGFAVGTGQAAAGATSRGATRRTQEDEGERTCASAGPAGESAATEGPEPIDQMRQQDKCGIGKVEISRADGRNAAQEWPASHDALLLTSAPPCLYSCVCPTSRSLRRTLQVFFFKFCPLGATECSACQHQLLILAWYGSEIASIPISS